MPKREYRFDPQSTESDVIVEVKGKDPELIFHAIEHALMGIVHRIHRERGPPR
jgi:hypothetical protein